MYKKIIYIRICSIKMINSANDAKQQGPYLVRLSAAINIKKKGS